MERFDMTVQLSRRSVLKLAINISAVLFCSSALKAAEVNVGDHAPQFSALDESGQQWNSSEHPGKKIVVLYFYPADMTGGCTKQACGFRDDLSKLKDKGVEVIGVSGDSVRNHGLFRKAHNLNFTLLADTEGRVAEAFGVPVTREEKTVKAVIDGQEELLTRNVTAKRWTFVIDRDGKVVAKNTMVAAADDSKAIAEIVAGLEKK
jgi:peroxiredoxin Q/BCP